MMIFDNCFYRLKPKPPTPDVVLVLNLARVVVLLTDDDLEWCSQIVHDVFRYSSAKKIWISIMNIPSLWCLNESYLQEFLESLRMPVVFYGRHIEGNCPTDLSFSVRFERCLGSNLYKAVRTVFTACNTCKRSNDCESLKQFNEGCSARD
jgi:hypothetical protein